MENVEEITRIMKAGSAAGRAQEPMRFATQEERNAWYEEQTEILAKVMAPVGDEPYDKNLQGHKIADRFADIHTFEIYRLTNIRYIIGDFETYEEYAAHCRAEIEAWADELRADLEEE